MQLVRHPGGTYRGDVHDVTDFLERGRYVAAHRDFRARIILEARQNTAATSANVLAPTRRSMCPHLIERSRQVQR